MKKHHINIQKRKVMRRRDMITVCLFSTGLLFLFILGLVMPLRPHVSDVEKRELEKFPEFQWESFFSGEYFNQITLWYADTFPFRERLLSANSKVKELYGIKSQQIYGAVFAGDEIPEAGPGPAAAIAATEEESEETIGHPPTESLLAESTEAEKGGGEGSQEAAAVGGDVEEAVEAAQIEEEQLADATIHTEPEVAGTVYIAEGKGFELYYFNREGSDLYASVINKMAQKLQGTATVYDLIVPTAVSVCLDEKIQESLRSSPQNKVLDYVYSQIGDNVKKVSVFDTLKKHNAEYIYYNTDHHWTALGAYYGYLEFAKAKGIQPHGLDYYETLEFDQFIGSFYSFSNQAEALKINPDTVTAYVPRGTNLMRYIQKDGQEIKWNIVNDVSSYAPGTKYSCFIGGDNPFSWINNPEVSDGSSCVVVKDSFGNAFVPFLVDHYQTVYVVDYRSYQDNLVDFVKENQVQDVIFVHNTDVLNKKPSQIIQGLME